MDYWISDLLTDLRHYVDQNGWDWDELNDRANMHFMAERDGNGGEVRHVFV